METFPSFSAEPGSVFQTLTTTSLSDSTSLAYAPSHQRATEPLSSLPQSTPLQLPVFVATDGIHQKVSEFKAVGGRPRFSLGPVSLPSSTAVAGVAGVAEFGKESGSNPAWAPITGGGYSIVAPGKQQSLSPQLGSREGGGIVLWPPTTNSPNSAAAIAGANGASGVGAGDKRTLLYGMFVRTEDGTRWQCVECKRLFSSQGSLRAHARIHTGERPYQCQYCFRTFCQASTLRSHERLHTGEKPYKCEHCGRAFTQSAGLRSHLKTHRYDS